MNDCPYCPRKIDFRTESFVVFVQATKDDKGKTKTKLKFAHYNCTEQKIEEHRDNYTEWRLQFAVHMMEDDQWEKHYKTPHEYNNNAISSNV